MNFSCLVEPPRKGVSSTPEPMIPEAPLSRVVKPVPPPAPVILPQPTGRATLDEPRRAPVAATTIPPFGSAASLAPFWETEDEPVEAPAPARRWPAWLSGSTVALVLACGVGFFQFQRMQQAKADAAALPEPGPAGLASPVEGQTSALASPFRAMKEGKRTRPPEIQIQRAAAFDTVESFTVEPKAAIVTGSEPTFRPATPMVRAVDAQVFVPGALLLDAKGNEIDVVKEFGEPTRAFLVWARSVRIAGVRAGASPRLLLGSESYAPGAIVDPALGVVFEGYDAEKQTLRFSEPSGAELMLRR